MSSPTPGYLKVYDPAKGLDHSVIIRAGAGAGKTTELVSRVISFGVEFRKKNKVWPNIVVTTFTIKATQELRERLVKAVIKAQGQESIFAQAEILDWVQSPSIFITTIHSLVLRYIREFGSLLGLRSDFEIDTNPQIKFKIFIKKLYFESTEFKLLIEPWIDTWNWSELLSMLRQACLVRLQIGKKLDYVKAQDELITFNKHKQMILNLTRQIIDLLSSADLSTAKRQQCFEYMKQVDQEANFEPSDYIAALNRVSFVTEQANHDLKQLKDDLKEIAKPYWSVDFLKHLEIDNAKFVELCEFIFARWLEYRILEQCLSLDEIEIFGKYLIERYPLTAEFFSKNWMYWYIDEYQDTSPLQVNIINALMGKKNGFFVGDPQQSIYLFRGARPQVFQDRWQILKNSNQSETLIFDTNYRTQAAVLDFINQTVTKKNVNFSAMIVGSNRPCHFAKAIELYQFEDGQSSQHNRSQASLAVLAIIKDKIQQGISLGQIAILARKRSELKQIAGLLRAQNINFQLHVGGAFYQRREVIDALSLLRFIIQPDDIKNLINLLNFKVFNLSKIQVNENKKWSELLNESIDCPVAKKLQGWLDLQKQEGQVNAWLTAIKDIKLFEHFYLQDSTGQKESNIFKLIQMVYDQQFLISMDWHQFYWDCMDQFELASDEADAVADLDPHRIQLMTVHGSKGLEFESVVYLHLPQLGKTNSQSGRFYFSEQEGVFTLARDSWIEEDEEWKYLFPPLYAQEQKLKRDWERQESDRVVYVALTRTKSNLVIIKPENFSDEWTKIFTQKYEFIKLDNLTNQTSPVSNESDSTIVKNQDRVLSIDWKSSSFNPLSVVSPVEMNWEIYLKQRAGIEAHLLFQRARFNHSITDNNTDLQWAIKLFPELKIGLNQGFAEWGFKFLEQNQWVQGRIDLWWFEQDKVYIIDYKTGLLLPEADRWKQLIRYAEALKKSKYLLPANIELVIINFNEQKVLKKLINKID